MKIPVQESCRAKIQIQENTGNTGTARGLNLASRRLRPSMFQKKKKRRTYDVLTLFELMNIMDATTSQDKVCAK